MSKAKYPPLTRQEFERAITFGHGRAFRHVKLYGLDGIADILLNACLNNLAYDPQCEGPRTEWLFPMFNDTPQFPEFREALLQSISIKDGLDEERDDTWDLQQRCGLIAKIAEKGDNETKEALRQLVIYNAMHNPLRSDWLGVDEWVTVSGAEGFLELIKIYGQQLLSNDQDSSNYCYFPEVLEEDDTKEEYIALMKMAKADSPAIQAYFNYYDHTTQKNSQTTRKPKIDLREQSRKKLTLEKILARAQALHYWDQFPGPYRLFGRYATQEELDHVYQLILAESNPDLISRYLRIFGNTPLPAIDPIFYSWATSSHIQLKSDTLSALAQLEHNDVHALAQHFIHNQTIAPENFDALNIFIKNYVRSDGILLQKAISNLDFLQLKEEEVHHLGYIIRDIIEKQNSPELRKCLPLMYEHNPCSICREKDIQLMIDDNSISKEILEESFMDGSVYIQTIARGYQKETNQWNSLSA